MLKRILLILLFSFIFMSCGEITEKRYDLVAFSNNTSVQASFFLIMGSVNSTPVYRFLYRREDGGIIQMEINITNTIIYEIEDAPYIVITHDTRANDKPYWEYKIFIPKNSIKKLYELDISKGDR